MKTNISFFQNEIMWNVDYADIGHKDEMAPLQLFFYTV